MSKETHSFSVDVATRIGVNSAIILQHLAHLHKVNLGNGENWKSGRYWINKTIKAMNIIYPYLTIKEIRGSLDRMEGGGYILSANMADNHFDRTKWYSIEEGGFDILGIPADLRHVAPEAFAKRANGSVQNGNSDFTKRANENVTKGQMNTKVYYSNYSNSTMSLSEKESDEGQTDFEQLWHAYAFKKGSKKTANARWNKLSQADRANVWAALDLYKRETVTEESAARAGKFKPMRKHLDKFLSARTWEAYIDRIEEQQNEPPTPFDENYKKYLTWVEQNYPAVLKSTAQLSRAQFVEFKSTSYVKGVRDIGPDSEMSMFKRAHTEFCENAATARKFSDVYEYHCSLIQHRVKIRQV